MCANYNLKFFDNRDAITNLFVEKKDPLFNVVEEKNWSSDKLENHHACLVKLRVSCKTFYSKKLTLSRIYYISCKQ